MVLVMTNFVPHNQATGRLMLFLLLMLLTLLLLLLMFLLKLSLTRILGS